MRTFNRVLATIISIALIVASAMGIVYLIGLLAGNTQLTGFVSGIIGSITRLDTGQIQATLIGIFLISLVLLILEIRPFRDPFITVRDDEAGKTRVFRSDVERFLQQRLARERGITPENVDVLVHGEKFDVAAEVAVSTDADRQAVRSQVEYDVKDNLATIGLDDELDHISTRVARVKRVA
ncbi:MAG: Asp23/Gls24 family envelope stress response protein [Candidatus Aquicultor sp.]